MPFFLNSLSCSKNYPRNINYIPAVIFFTFLDLRKNYYSRAGSYDEFLKGELQEKEYQQLRHHERTGRSLGSDLLIDKLEVLLGKQLRKKKTGPKGPWKNRKP